MAADDPDLPRSLLDAPGCYTTARVRDGHVRHAERHVRRLRRDARALGLAEPATETLHRAFGELARAEFGVDEGSVRLAACDLGDGRTALIGTPRPIGEEPDTWTALTAPFPHPGPTPPIGAKLSQQPVLLRAREHSTSHGADETLLFDAAGRLVEGARSNLLLVDENGRPLWPDPALGAVAGIALEIVQEHFPEASPAPLYAADLTIARELIALNAVRGASPITTLDHHPIADSHPGPWARELKALLD